MVSPVQELVFNIPNARQGISFKPHFTGDLIWVPLFLFKKRVHEQTSGSSTRGLENKGSSELPQKY